jgi:hypothetical protein
VNFFIGAVILRAMKEWLRVSVTLSVGDFKRRSVTLSVGTPLLPYDIAYDAA